MKRLRFGLLALVAICAVSFADPATAGDETGAPVERLLIFSLPTVDWSELDNPDLTNLDAFVDGAAIADLSVRGVARSTSATDGYATVSAGTRARGTRSAASAFEEGETVDGQPAVEEFTRRTGVSPVSGEVFNLGVVQIEVVNDRLTYGAEIGALAAALDGAGIRRSVIANADRVVAGETDRQAAATVGLMDDNGLVPHSRIGGDLLLVDPLAPYGLRLDEDVVVDEFSAVWDDGGAVMVEASDLVRYDSYRSLLSPSQRVAMRHDVLVRTDDLFGRLMAQVDPEHDAVMLVGPYHRSGDAHLTVAALDAPGIEPGLLRSGTTRRTGFVTLSDVAPTVVELFGIPRPDEMEGRPWEWGGTGGSVEQRRAFLVDADTDARFRDDHVASASTWYVIGQFILWILAAATLRWGRRSHRRTVEVLALAGITFLPATHLATLFPFDEWGESWWWTFIAGASLVLALVAWLLGRRQVVDGLIVALSMVVGLLAVDVLTGAHLQLNAVFGYSPTIAGRFAGFGNLAFAQLAAAAIMLAALIFHRVGGRRGFVYALVVLGAAVVLDGSPYWGSDVGGVLALVPAAGVTAWMLLGRRVRVTTALLWGAGALALVLAFGAVDLLRPPDARTHLGRLLESIGNEGLGPFTDVVTRKLDSNLGVLTSTVWTLMVPVVIGFVGYLFWRAPGELRRVSQHVPAERAALVGLGIAMLFGFALNDSGIAVPGVMLGVVNASLVYLLMRTVDEPPPTTELAGDDEIAAPTDTDRYEAAH